MKTKRYAWSPAYVDSSLVTGYLVGVISVSVFLGVISSGVINPYWLGVSAAAVAIYELFIYWLLRQYWEPDKIFFIFTTNVASLAIILLCVGVVLGVRLPVDMPVFSVIVWLAGLQAVSYSPGLVAASYGILSLLGGLVGVFLVMLFDDLAFVERLKKIFGLKRIDLWIDTALDRYSFWMDRGTKAWVITPMTLLFIVVSVVVGGAALI